MTTTTEVLVPALPESVADATVLTWHKKPGDPVKKDENLVDLETDKVVLEVPAPADGQLVEILIGEGATVTAATVLARIGAAGAAPAAQPPAPAAAPAQPTPAGEAVLAPAARRLVKELDLNPAEIAGSGKGGRIHKADVVAHLDQREATAAVVDAEIAARPLAAQAPALGGEAGRPEQRVAMTRLRARVAERLVQAQQTAAILTTFNEVDMQPIMDLRNKYKEPFEKTHNVRMGFMSFFVKAAVEALRRFPIINASVDGGDIIYHGYYDIGIAVSSPRGLVVPILRNCDRLSMAEVEQGIAEFGRKAKEGSLSFEDLTGGTFSITNGGVFGSLLSTPILNPPQSAILGMHKIQERPMVVKGQIVARPMMYLALSYDHRIIDGRDAVQFLVTLKDMVEDPSRLLLGV